MSDIRATYIGDCTEPAPQSQGIAYPANGYSDIESAAFGAWMFNPDGEEVSYYVSEDDLLFA